MVTAASYDPQPERRAAIREQNEVFDAMVPLSGENVKLAGPTLHKRQPKNRI
jgi:hypothetical protein